MAAANKHLKNLEALRGLCALSVLGAHTFGLSEFAKAFGSQLGPIGALFPAHLGVLYFFLLSGFVIGSAHKEDRPFDPWLYMRKRAVRIYPMYILALALGSLATATLGLLPLAKSLLLISTTYPGNMVLWSVCFEFWFYMTLPIIFLMPIKPRLAAYSLAVLSLIVYFGSPGSSLRGDERAWFLGLFIWLVGLLISWSYPQNRESGQPERFSMNFLAYFTMGAAYYSIAGGVLFTALGRFNIFGDLSAFKGIISPADLAGLPVITCGFLLLLGQNLNKWFNYTFWICLFLTASILAASMKSGAFWEVSNYPAAAIFLLTAAVIKCFLCREKGFAIENLSKLGGISYGIYIFHMPLLSILYKATSPLATLNQGIQAFVGISAALFVTLLISYVTERKIQPALRRRLLKS